MFGASPGCAAAPEAAGRGEGRARVLGRLREGSRGGGEAVSGHGTSAGTARTRGGASVAKHFLPSVTTQVGEAAERGGLRTEALAQVQFCCKKSRRHSIGRNGV